MLYSYISPDLRGVPNEISIACSWDSGKYTQRIWKKSKQCFWRGQRSKYLQRRGSCVLYRMKPYKNSNESPFFMLQDGALNIKILKKWQSYRGMNSSGYSQNLRKFGSSNLEAIQRMKLKFCVTSCDHKYSIKTKVSSVSERVTYKLWLKWYGMTLILLVFSASRA